MEPKRSMEALRVSVRQSYGPSLRCGSMSLDSVFLLWRTIGHCFGYSKPSNRMLNWADGQVYCPSMTLPLSTNLDLSIAMQISCRDVPTCSMKDHRVHHWWSWRFRKEDQRYRKRIGKPRRKSILHYRKHWKKGVVMYAGWIVIPRKSSFVIGAIGYTIPIALACQGRKYRSCIGIVPNVPRTLRSMAPRI